MNTKAFLIGLWLACGSVFPIAFLFSDDDVTVGDIGIMLLCLLFGPVITFGYLFAEDGMGKTVIWKRKSSTNHKSQTTNHGA